MKTILMAIAIFGIIGSSAFAAEHNYQCISDSLQAINSDIWYNLSKDEINEMLNSNVYGHTTAVEVAARCDARITPAQYRCISDSLQAINSDIWYNLSKDEIDEMLNNEMTGHLESQKAAVRCGVDIQE